MYILVIGCGRSGSLMANLLSEREENVVVIDNDKDAFNNLRTEFTGFTIEGDATEIEVLKKAKIEQADIVIVATNNDNNNAMIAQIASEIYGKKTLVRLLDSDKEIIYDGLDIITICPTDLLAKEFINVLDLD